MTQREGNRATVRIIFYGVAAVALLASVSYLMQVDARKQRQEREARAHVACVGWGFKLGTFDYERCRLTLLQVRP